MLHCGIFVWCIVGFVRWITDDAESWGIGNNIKYRYWLIFYTETFSSQHQKLGSRFIPVTTLGYYPAISYICHEIWWQRIPSVFGSGHEGATVLLPKPDNKTTEPSCPFALLLTTLACGWAQTLNQPWILFSICNERELLSFWWKCHHLLHWKLTFWQPMQPAAMISSKSHYRFCVWDKLARLVFRFVDFSMHFSLELQQNIVDSTGFDFTQWWPDRFTHISLVFNILTPHVFSLAGYGLSFYSIASACYELFSFFVKEYIMLHVICEFENSGICSFPLF